MSNDINHLDTKDEGLKGIFGDRFSDATAENPEKKSVNAPKANTTQKGAEKPKTKAVPATQWEPVPERSFPQKLVACAKKALVYAGLCLLFFYWQQSGQMEPSAAVPCMMFCTAMVGCTYGKVFAKECY